MKILFVHQNFPGQYRHLARHLASLAGNEVVFITQRQGAALPGVRNIVYQPSRKVTPHLHHYLRESEAGVLNAQAVMRTALDLKRSGFVPDLMIGHNGWGEIWYLKDIFPRTPLLGYFEFFYRLHGADVGFDPAEPMVLDTAPRIRTKNVGNLLGLDAADCGVTPTRWQKSTYPERYQPMLQVIHDGIDVDGVVPDGNARLRLPQAEVELKAGDEVLTYVARNLEPYRGFPTFMRSLPLILARRPKAQVVIVGGDEVSYGRRPRDDKTYREQLLEELGDGLDYSRVHFLGRVPYPTFRTVLQVSRAHVYLTYPFVLSWSMLEAMAAQCLVIASMTAPVQEVIRNGENGLLVDFFSPNELADRVVAALEDPEALAPIRRRARETIVANYDLNTKCLPEQMRLVEELAGLKR
jgi:glycosyltransferase involved in cell wall biosynthesis